MEIHVTDAKELCETTDVEEVNEKLRDGWVLIEMTRGNLKYLYVLARI